MIAAEQLQRDTRFTAIALKDFMKLEVPPTTYLVGGFVVEGSAVIFSAREKAGKGLIAIDMLISIATGTPFLDRPVKEGPVIYVALEENVGTLKARLHSRWPSHDDFPLYIVQLDGSFDSEAEFYIDTPEGVDGQPSTSPVTCRRRSG